MKNVKNWAVLTACVAVAFAGSARAETPADNSTWNLSRPAMLDDAAPPDRPLTQGLNAMGMGKPLSDLGITVGGYIETSNTAYADRAPTKFNPGRGFDAEDQDPTLNAITFFVNRNVTVSKDKWDIGGRMEWTYGADARFIHSTGLFDNMNQFSGENNQFDLIQAYIDLAIPVGNGLQLRMGKFVTPAGEETIDTTQNFLYSRGLLFTYLLPFTHTGVYGTYSLDDQWTFNLGVIRGWDDALEDKNDGQSVIGGGTYNFSDKKQSIAVVIIAGPELANDSDNYRYLIDTVYKYNYADNLVFAGEADILYETEANPAVSSDGGYAGGVGGWVSWRPGNSKYIAVNGRLEYLYDGDGMRVVPGTSNDYYSATIGLDTQPFADNAIGSFLHLRPSVRYDYAESAVFGGNNNNQITFSLDAYFAF
jgi:hypothetical protein